MKSEIRVTAIITTYKRSDKIVRRAAESVLNQTLKNIELIIVDDSPDSYSERKNVENMAKSLGDRVRYIKHEVNKGACAARNTGIKYANGEYIAFLDDDDEWFENKIEKQLEIFINKSGVALVYCGSVSYNEKSQSEYRLRNKFYRGMVFDKLIKKNFIGSTSFPLIKKSVLEEVGGFDVNMKAAQDFELWLRIAQNYEIDYVEDSLVRYYIHEGEQITNNYRNKVDALNRINEYHKDYLIKHKMVYSNRLYVLAFFTSKFDKAQAKMIFKKAVKICPSVSVEMLRAFKWIYIK